MAQFREVATSSLRSVAKAMSQRFDPGFAGRVVEPRHEIDAQADLAAGARYLTAAPDAGSVFRRTRPA
jgi:hypothetical protein